MSSKNKSFIWKIPDSVMQKLIDNSNSYSEILTKLGYNKKGGNINTLNKRIKASNLDLSKIELNRKEKAKKHQFKIIPLEQILVKNSTYCSSNNLKAKLFKNKLLTNKCYECNITSEWNNKPLCLQLDHINGIRNDNRLDNLRLLCPNCHSQTPTYAGKRFKKNRPPQTSEINPNWNKQPKFNLRKVARPSREELQKMLWEKPTMQIAKEYEVSDVAVAKWAKWYKISKPPRGYWTKLKFEK